MLNKICILCIPFVNMLQQRAELIKNALIVALSEFVTTLIGIEYFFLVNSKLCNKVCGRQHSRKFLKWKPDEVATFGADLIVHKLWPSYCNELLALEQNASLSTRKVSKKRAPKCQNINAPYSLAAARVIANQLVKMSSTFIIVLVFCYTMLLLSINIARVRLAMQILCVCELNVVGDRVQLYIG